MTTTPLRRLTSIGVIDLFDVYSHHIPLNLNDRVTFLHGPNGVGKTALLRMTNALLCDDLALFRPIPFSRFSLTFDDQSTLELWAQPVTDLPDRKFILRCTKDDIPYETTVDWSARADIIAAKVDHLRKHESPPHSWIDIRDGEVLSAAKVLERYANIPASSQSLDEDMAWYTDFLTSANSHLIEAQRLVRLEWDPKPQGEYVWPHRQPSMVSTVLECSEDFRLRIRDTMAHYGRQSQTLDQSFPQRLITATDQLTPKTLQDKMTGLDKKTGELKEIGILDETPEHPFDVKSLEDIDDTQARVMTLYVSDTETKLMALDDLARRTRLLLQNVNKKYQHKRIRLDRKSGFLAESDSGHNLPLDSLSSGEQHELVLHYYLLFRVPSNTIVLIDEPELSLHVAWQRRFLPDLLEIAKISDLDAVVATHSPYIIGDRNDLMVGLGG